jgi:hypothetical protein
VSFDDADFLAEARDLGRYREADNPGSYDRDIKIGVHFFRFLS